MPFSTIPEAIEDIRAGRMVVVVDDEDRENEGDLTIAAEKVTPDVINFMARYGRGLICLPMTGERLDELRIPLMVRDEQNDAKFGTAFCVPDRGEAGHDHRHLRRRPRAHRAGGHRPDDAARRPGAARPHVPAARRWTAACWCARARPRRRWTSRAWPASIRPGVICEIMDEDGTMARVPQLAAFCRAARPAHDHDQGPDPAPHAARAAGAQDRRGQPAHATTAPSASTPSRA